MQPASVLLLIGLTAVFPTAAQDRKLPAADPVIARVGDTAFLRVEATGLDALTPRQKALAYWLTRAAIAIDPIIYDQLSAYGLRQKRLLEEVVARRDRLDPKVASKIHDYALLFWASRGNHKEGTSLKFLPEFTFEELKSAAFAAQRAGAMKTACGLLPPLTTRAELDRELDDLRPSIFDPQFEPTATSKSPPPGKDIVQASSNTFYSGVSLADLDGFREEHALNSRVVRDEAGKLRELVYRAGTPDRKFAPGLYALYLSKAIEFLERARSVADPAQGAVIADLIRYYRTGAFEDWLAFDTDWVHDDPAVDFVNGFIEVYRDPRAAKGSASSFVGIPDPGISASLSKLAGQAAYFEARAPWDDRYKRTDFDRPVVKAIDTLVETGDFLLWLEGENLPNEDAIHDHVGSKNFLLRSSTRANRALSGDSRVAEEFGASVKANFRAAKYRNEAWDLQLALHEVVGHGSGRTNERFPQGTATVLTEYYSTLEEARADLMGLWAIWDPKLKELGLVGDQDDVAKTLYDEMSLESLRQLLAVPDGDQLEEDHLRARQLIIGFISDTTGSIERFKRDGKTFIRVNDYDKMKAGVGALLSELMRIKAEGDYEAIKTLVEKYAVHFDPLIRDEIVARFRALNFPPHTAGVYPRVRASFNKDGSVVVVSMGHPRDPALQYLEFAAMYNSGLRATIR
jgi:dipeptidyl-peptidase-3